MKREPLTLESFKNTVAGQRVDNAHLFEVGKKKEKRSKYNNVKVEFDGKIFDSKKELDRYITLRMRLVAHEIEDLQCQVEFVLESNDTKVCSYIADYVYTEKGNIVIEDVKSQMTRRLAPYRLKKKLMKAQFNIDIKEI